MPIKTYKIIEPRIRTESKYYFTSDQGIEYEVGFGRDAEKYYVAIVAFSVLNEEFDNEYAETNKGEFFRVIHTVIKIMDMYIAEHTLVRLIKFSAQAGKGENDNKITKRLKFYKRYIPLYESKGWKTYIEGNHVFMQKA